MQQAYRCTAENCTKTFTQSQGLARHIRNEKAKEASKEEHLRVHSALIVRPRGRIPRQEQADENPPEPVGDAVQLELNEQEPAQPSQESQSCRCFRFEGSSGLIVFGRYTRHERQDARYLANGRQ